MYQLSGGASLGAAARCGNLVGAGRMRRATHAGWAALGTGVLFGSLSMVLMLLFQRPLARLFSPHDHQVVLLVLKVVEPPLSLSLPCKSYERGLRPSGR